jgi:hypothetical protein
LYVYVIRQGPNQYPSCALTWVRTSLVQCTPRALTLHWIHIHTSFTTALIKQATFTLKIQVCFVLYKPIMAQYQANTIAQLRDKSINLTMILVYPNMDFNIPVCRNLITISSYQTVIALLYFKPIGISSNIITQQCDAKLSMKTNAC